jgi:hypothetical protein
MVCNLLRFAVEMLVTMKNIFLWGVMLYGLMDCFKRFGGFFYFHLQDRRQTNIEKVSSTISFLIVSVSVEKLNKRINHFV